MVTKQTVMFMTVCIPDSLRDIWFGILPYYAMRLRYFRTLLYSTILSKCNFQVICHPENYSNSQLSQVYLIWDTPLTLSVRDLKYS